MTIFLLCDEISLPRFPMKKKTDSADPILGFVLLTVCSLFLSSCGLFSHDIPRFGIGGRYNEGREQFTRGCGGDMDRAVSALEPVPWLARWLQKGIGAIRNGISKVGCGAPFRGAP